MKLLVTGGAGFIGSNFIRYWLGNHPGDRIINIDKLTYAGNRANLQGLPSTHEFLHADICDPAMDDCMKGVDAVVHFAAESHVDRSIDAAEIFVKTNVLGTQRLLEAARRQRVSLFIQIGTDEVYGALGETGEFIEETPLRANSPYSASKAAADLLARSYFHTYGLPVIITRCSNNYGPYQHPEKFIPLMTTNALADLPIPVYGRGAQVREWLHVEDHCRALEAILRKGRPGEIYNIGSGHRLNNLQVAETILKLLGKPSSLIQFVADRPGHDFRYAVDSSKLRRELGWRHEMEWEEGLRQTVHWFRDNPAWVRAARGEAYDKYYSQMYEKRDQFLGKL
ncbi:MAG: dTDP-glucose 4,6-dehydratase [Acidobacteria bacterium RIFCSPLOWO2_02_FULL_60_20]|nr:MAG: dTDP-glucose 4,6-dehydratase [Acidobacteria bacterium RIFCSPLOWO2_02_FULL_60_20]